MGCGFTLILVFFAGGLVLGFVFFFMTGSIEVYVRPGLYIERVPRWSGAEFLTVPQFGGHALFVTQAGGRHRGSGPTGFVATLLQGDPGGFNDPDMA